MNKLMVLVMVLSLTCGAFAATMVWPQQDAKDWDAMNAVWTTGTGGASAAPGSADYAYMLSTNSATVDSAITVKRLYVDRSTGSYASVPSIVNIVQGGTLTVTSICQLGYGIAGGTINVAGGDFIVHTLGDRTNTWSFVIENTFAGVLNVTSGKLSIQNNTLFQFEAGSQGDVTVSGTGIIEFLGGSRFDMQADALGVNISDGGLIKFAGRDASTEIQTLADAGQLTGLLPLAIPLYTSAGNSNGIGWYFDGTDTYAFAVPEPATLILLAIGSFSFLRNRRKA